MEYQDAYFIEHDIGEAVVRIGVKVVVYRFVLHCRCRWYIEREREREKRGRGDRREGGRKNNN